ncbi:MAG TPA: hypothetical protein VK717_00785 [Opitutaceae bacterium]|nr:hypothetical protein [Opitutaceae bacterium]
MPVLAESFRVLTPDPVPPGDYLSPSGISARDNVIAGTSYPFFVGRPWFAQAFRWTKAGGAVGLGFLPNGEGSDVSGMSRRGDVIVGTSYQLPGEGDPVPTPQAYRWTEAGGMVGLGADNSFAGAVSADGDVVVGEVAIAPQEGGFEHAFSWTQATGLQDLGTLGGDYSAAAGVSSNGDVITGVAANAEGEWLAFRWTQLTGMVGLDLPPGDDLCELAIVSANGRVIVGQTESLDVGVTHSFRWTERHGLENIPALSPGQQIRAVAVSDDGSVIVGAAMAGNNFHAFLWTKKEGTRSIQDILMRNHKLAATLAGWTLTDANAVSPDGRKIAGLGTDPNGNQQGWEAELPDER